MSFVARDDSIFRKMLDRLNLKTINREPLYVPSMIVPVTSVDQLLNNLELLAHTSTTATARTDDYEVPTGKRWEVVGCSMIRANAGDYFVQIVDPGGTSLYVKRGATVTNDEEIFSTPLMLDEGWILRLQNTTGTSGAIDTTVMYKEEDAF